MRSENRWLYFFFEELGGYTSNSPGIRTTAAAVDFGSGDGGFRRRRGARRRAGGVGRRLGGGFRKKMKGRSRRRRLQRVRRSWAPATQATARIVQNFYRLEQRTFGLQPGAQPTLASQPSPRGRRNWRSNRVIGELVGRCCAESHSPTVFSLSSKKKLCFPSKKSPTALYSNSVQM